MTKPDWHNEFLDHEESRANAWLCDNPKEGQMKLAYFAEDGNWGRCQVLILNTETWTQEDWEAIDCAPDHERIHLADAIDTEKRRKND